MSKTEANLPLQNIRIDEESRAVVILDQTRLPGDVACLALTDAAALFETIASLRVRGAPAIGICAAYGLYVCALRFSEEEREAFLAALEKTAAYLASARPTAVNLSWALSRMTRRAGQTAGGRAEILRALREECAAIHEEDIAACRAIAEHGLSLLRNGDGLLTHCNAGPLATSRYGTALGPILLGHERGIRFHVFADETRPLLQGARLTAFELHRAGVDVTLICDNMAASVMSRGLVRACLVGCDRVAANGDTANKIGTCGVAVLAKHYGIPFYVLGPTSTIDLNCASGEEIEIEQRDGEEIRSMWYARPMAPEGVRCMNPAFDVTDHRLITAIVTEKGIARPPYTESLRAFFA